MLGAHVCWRMLTVKRLAAFDPPRCRSINPKRTEHAVKDGALGVRARGSRHRPKLSVFSRRPWLPYQLGGCNGLAIGREGRRSDHAWPVPRRYAPERAWFSQLVWLSASR